VNCIAIVGSSDGNVRQRRRILNRGNGLADSDAFDSSDGDDVATSVLSMSTRFNPLMRTAL